MRGTRPMGPRLLPSSECCPALNHQADARTDQFALQFRRESPISAAVADTLGPSDIGNSSTDIGSRITGTRVQMFRFPPKHRPVWSVRLERPLWSRGSRVSDLSAALATTVPLEDAVTKEE
jgi:hypothetical protein